ncbi:hypothetical protein ACHAWU_004921 [Discostella pseudostelligera]|uniref:Uncharacterized protein n=1 Tax=Discostella pseudostelligera TaxID=259834 RepID=A0ABD3M9P5_9STRA
MRHNVMTCGGPDDLIKCRRKADCEAVCSSLSSSICPSRRVRSPPCTDSSPIDRSRGLSIGVCHRSVLSPSAYL